MGYLIGSTGQAIFDFTSVAAFQVTQTGGVGPALIVDTTNTRVGIGVQPITTFHARNLAGNVGQPVGLFECLAVGSPYAADAFGVTMRRDDTNLATYTYLSWEGNNTTGGGAVSPSARIGARTDDATTATYTGRLDFFLNISGTVTDVAYLQKTTEAGGVFDWKPFVSGNGNLGTASLPWRKLYAGSSVLSGLVTTLNGIGSGVVFAQTADATVGNSTAETTLTAAGTGTRVLPANILSAGKTIRVTARGYVSETGNPTFRVRIKLGATTILDTTAVSFTGNLTNQEWSVSADITCRTTGVSGTVMGQGRFVCETGDVFGMVLTAAVTVNTTTTETVDVTAQWGTAAAGDTITCTNLTVEVLS